MSEDRVAIFNGILYAAPPVGVFLFGSGSQPDFSGVQFAKQGIILMTFNYRHGSI